jgi:hypothetical protein
MRGGSTITTRLNIMTVALAGGVLLASWAPLLRLALWYSMISICTAVRGAFACLDRLVPLTVVIGVNVNYFASNSSMRGPNGDIGR